MLHNFMHATREAGLRMKDYYTSGANAARVHIEAAERYGLDGILLDIDTAVMAEALGVPVDHPDDSPPRVKGSRIDSLEAVRDLPPPNVAASPRVQVSLEAAGRIKDYFGDEVYLRGNCDQAPFSLASMVRGAADWMMDLATDGEAAVPLLDYCLEACLQLIDLMVQQGVHMISHGDSPAGPDVVSPAMFRQYAAPYERKLCERAHAAGLPYLMHICGKTDRIVTEFRTLEFDAVELDYKTDIHLIHHELGEEVTLFGNLDPTGVLTNGSVEFVEEMALDLLQLYADSPRLVLNAGCAIPASAPAKNLERLVYVAHNFPV